MLRMQLLSPVVALAPLPLSCDPYFLASMCSNPSPGVFLLSNCVPPLHRPFVHPPRMPLRHSQRAFKSHSPSAHAIIYDAYNFVTLAGVCTRPVPPSDPCPARRPFTVSRARALLRVVNTQHHSCCPWPRGLATMLEFVRIAQARLRDTASAASFLPQRQSSSLMNCFDVEWLPGGAVLVVQRC